MKYLISAIIRMQKNYTNMRTSAWDWTEFCITRHISYSNKGQPTLSWPIFQTAGIESMRSS